MILWRREDFSLLGPLNKRKHQTLTGSYSNNLAPETLPGVSSFLGLFWLLLLESCYKEQFEKTSAAMRNAHTTPISFR